MVKTAVWVQGACQELKIKKKNAIFPTPTLRQQDEECRLKPFALTSQNLKSNFSSLRSERLLPEHPYNAMQNRYRNNFWRHENYSNVLKPFLLLLLRNATKHSSIKFSAARLHVSSDKFWNCLKDLKCNNVKNYCLLVNKRKLLSTKLKKNICNTCYRLNVKNSERNLRKQLIFYDARIVCRMLDTNTDTSPCISFF